MPTDTGLPTELPFTSSIYDLDTTYNGELISAIQKSRDNGDIFRVEQLYRVMNDELLRRYYDNIEVAKRDARPRRLIPFLEKGHLARLKQRLHDVSLEPEYLFAVLLIALNRHYGYKTKEYEDKYISQEEVAHFGRVVPAGCVLNQWLTTPMDNMLYSSSLPGVKMLLREISLIFEEMEDDHHDKGIEKEWNKQLSILLKDLDRHISGKKRTTAHQRALYEKERMREAVDNPPDGSLAQRAPKAECTSRPRMTQN